MFHDVPEWLTLRLLTSTKKQNHCIHIEKRIYDMIHTSYDCFLGVFIIFIILVDSIVTVTDRKLEWTVQYSYTIS